VFVCVDFQDVRGRESTFVHSTRGDGEAQRIALNDGAQIPAGSEHPAARMEASGDFDDFIGEFGEGGGDQYPIRSGCRHSFASVLRFALIRSGLICSEQAFNLLADLRFQFAVEIAAGSARESYMNRFDQSIAPNDNCGRPGIQID